MLHLLWIATHYIFCYLHFIDLSKCKGLQDFIKHPDMLVCFLLLWPSHCVKQIQSHWKFSLTIQHAFFPLNILRCSHLQFLYLNFFLPFFVWTKIIILDSRHFFCSIETHHSGYDHTVTAAVMPWQHTPVCHKIHCQLLVCFILGLHCSKNVQ